LHWNYLPSLCLSVPKNFYPKNHWFSLWLELLLNVYDVAIDMANPNMGSQVVLFLHMQLFWLFFFWCAQIKKSKFCEMCPFEKLWIWDMWKYIHMCLQWGVLSNWHRITWDLSCFLEMSFTITNSSSFRV
jgi:hypothetical protein